METLGQCIYAWMQAEDMTVSQLAEKLGYKSKTSLFRLLHGKSNYQSCLQFCGQIAPGLDESWKNRFHQALLTEKIGMNRHSLLDAMNRCLFEYDNTDPHPFNMMTSVPFTGGTVTILGCAWPGIFALIDELLSVSDRLQVIHYFTRRDLFDFSELLPGLISHVISMNYSAVLLDETALHGTSVPWNIALWADKQEACIMLMNDGKCLWQPLSGGAANGIISILNAFPQTPLYRYEHLQTSKDYIEFTEQNYRMEYNRKALIFKPSPGMQMLPADIVERSFIDFLEDNLEPVAAARNTLIYTFEKRVKNFYFRSKPTYLVLSLESMFRFARDGVLDDQFFACRPFTESERVNIINTLQDFSRKEDVYVSFRDQASWPVSVEVYDGQGVLFYPSSSNYNATQSDYRELFLPGKEYSNLFFLFAKEYGFFDHRSLKNNDNIFRRLLNAVNMAYKTDRK